MQTYSRNQEDELLLPVFADINDGFYIDVGACMPIVDSNTYALYQKGWSGLIIEPLLAIVPELVSRWETHRPRDHLVFGMAAECCGERPFYTANHAQMSTGAVDRWRTNKDVLVCEPTALVKCYSLDALLHTLPLPMSKPIHLLSVDVEGMEDAVMAGIDLQYWRPWIIVIEVVHPGSLEPCVNGVRHRIESSGYRFAFNDQVNDWYVAEEVIHRWRPSSPVSA